MVNDGTIQSDKLTKIDYAFAGAFSGFVTRGLCQPLDVLKIRFQLQVESISHQNEGKYKSFLHALKLMNSEEGLFSLWKGHIPAQLLSVVYGMTQFWCFESLNRASKYNRYFQNHQNTSNFLSGAIAGGLATLVSFPFDVIRTRLVAQGEQCKLYSGFCHCSYYMYKREGFLVLYKGLLPTLIQVAPHAGVQFMSYKFFQSVLNSIRFKNDFSFGSSLLCGSLAGFFAKISVYPFDVIKKRIQVQGIEDVRKPFGKVFICTGMMDCAQKIYKFEGFAGFYKGLYPSLLKAVITSGFYFASYDLMCKILENLK